VSARPVASLPPGPPTARRSPAAAAWGGSLWIIAGVGAHTLGESILDVTDELWRLDLESGAWQAVPRREPWPEARRCCGWLPVDGELLLWGGSGVSGTGAGCRHTFLNDEWLFDPAGETWSRLRESEDHRDTPAATDRPFPRYTPNMALAGGDLFLFGGYTEDRLGKRKLDDLWRRREGHWAPVAAGEPAGHGPGAARPGLRYGAMISAGEGGFWLYGGFRDAGDCDDLWWFDTGRESWSLVTPEGPRPGARYCGALAADGDRLLLFGGRTRTPPVRNYADLWLFEPRERRWICVAEAAAPGFHAKSAHAIAGRHLYLWAGEGLHGHVSDLWRLDLDTLDWERLAAGRADDPVLW